jgi:predicted nucleic acid-binding protein
VYSIGFLFIYGYKYRHQGSSMKTTSIAHAKKQLIQFDSGKGITSAYADGEIAAIAASHELILVRRNAIDFQCFPDLTLQNWFDEV